MIKQLTFEEEWKSQTSHHAGQLEAALGHKGATGVYLSSVSFMGNNQGGLFLSHNTLIHLRDNLFVWCNFTITLVLTELITL